MRRSAGTLVFSAPASGARYYFSGNDLYRKCQGNTYELGICLGVVIGVIDEWENFRESDHLSPCLPSTVEGGQLRDVVVKYLTEHPEVRDQPAWALVVQAAVQAWNCK